MARLCDLLEARRGDILRAWTSSIRLVPGVTEVSTLELLDHLPQILRELTGVLRAAEAEDVTVTPDPTSTSGKHGSQRFRLGFDVDAVVREYGLLQRCIIEVVDQEGFTLNLTQRRVVSDFIFTGVSDAVTQYTNQRDDELHRQANEHFAFVAHELRNPLASVLLSLGSLRQSGHLIPSPQTDVLVRGIQRMRDLVENTLSLAIVRQGVDLRTKRISLRGLVDDALADSAVAANEKQITLDAPGKNDLEIDVDERLLSSALTNVVTNGVKFSHAGGTVRVRFGETNGNVVIDVDDSCGGLPPGAIEKMFLPFVQVGKDRSGFGLGLAIARQAVEAHGGSLLVKDRPGEGCTISLALPRVTTGVERAVRA